MSVIKFPPVEYADSSGLLALGGDLEVSTLKLAYKSGIFPWPISDEFPLAWFSPDPRGIIDFSNLNINKRLKRILRNHSFEITFNQKFSEVIKYCSKVPRPNQNGTWITDEIIKGYYKLFNQELAYSVEVSKDERLVGGIYGVCLDGIISGESMFYLESNASKIALVTLIQKLQQSGIYWIDTQMVTPVVEELGGKEIPRNEFLIRLKNSKLISRKQIFGN